MSYNRPHPHPHPPECKKSDKYEQYCLDGGCPVHAVEELDISVPAYIKTKAEVGAVKLTCMGARIIKGTNRVRGCLCEETTDRFVIRQKLRVDIPIKYDIDAYVGEGHVDFKGITGPREEGCDCDCD